MKNRFGKRGVWRDRHMNVTAVAPAKAAKVVQPPQRVAHTVVKAPERKYWRVVRLYMNQGDVQVEDIGAFDDAVNALRMLPRERWKARVLNPEGGVYADNYQPMEERT
jgi:hypothetical protein